MKDGLPSNRVNDLIRDSRGFYWIATDGGLVKWYGNNFDIIGTEQGLPSLNISALAEDGEGNLWIGMAGHGVSRYDGKVFTLVIPQDSLPGPKINRISWSSKYNLILTATDGGFVTCTGQDFKVFKPEHHRFESAAVNITGFMETDSFIFVHPYKGETFLYCPEKKEIAPSAFHSEQEGPVSSSYVTSANDTIWGLVHENILITGKRGGKHLTGIATVNDYCEDPSGNIYLAASSNPFNWNGGIFRLHGGNLESLNQLYGIDAGYVCRVIFDESDHLIVIADRQKGIFILYPRLIENKFDGLPPAGTMNVKGLETTADGIFWVLDEHELFFKKPGGPFTSFDIRILQKEYDRFKKDIFPEKFSYFLDPQGSYDKYQAMQESGRYPYPNPYVEIHDHTDIIVDDKFLYSPEEYDYLSNIRPETFRDISSRGNSLWILGNTGFYEICNGQVNRFIDYFKHVNRFNVSSINSIVVSLNRYLNILDHGQPPHRISVGPVASVVNMKNSPDGIWLACRNSGLYLARGKDILHLNSENPDLLTSVRALTLDLNGNIIIGSASGRIQVLGFRNDSLEILHALNHHDYFTGNIIHWIEACSNGFLWVGTNLGINRIDLEGLYTGDMADTRFIDREEGVSDQAAIVSYAGSDGDIWLGGQGMLTRVNSGMVDITRHGPRNVFIRDMEIDFRKAGDLEIPGINSWTGMPLSGLTLKHNHNSLGFYLGTVNIGAQDKTVFRYRVRGINEDWSPFDDTRYIIYPKLRPGRYTLEIEARVAKDAGSLGYTGFSFRVLPPWWQTWWFYSALWLFITGCFWIVMIIRIKHIRKTEFKKLIQEREISELKIRALQSQMNPHFTFNAINSIQYYMIESDKDNAFLFINYFSNLIRQTLEFASRDSVSIKEEALFLENYIRLEQMRFENKFRYAMIISPGFNNHHYQIPPMLLQPFVENSILHGLLHKDEPGVLKIEFRPAGEKMLQCIIEDNGVGRKRSAEINRGRHGNHKSVGLEITRQRVKLLNDPGRNDYRVEITDMQDDNNMIAGTRVMVIVPLFEKGSEVDEVSNKNFC
jgi:hypothetical protein